MINSIYKNALILLLLVLLQALVLNNIHLLGMGTPFLYIYGIMLLPNTYWRVSQVLIAFGLGIAIDLFSNTLGMHASAAMCIGVINLNLFKLFMPKNDFEETQASISRFGFKSFFYYTVIVVLIHHTILMFLEAYSFAHPIQTLTRIALCSGLTILFILFTDTLIHPSK